MLIAIGIAIQAAGELAARGVDFYSRQMAEESRRTERAIGGRSVAAGTGAAPQYTIIQNNTFTGLVDTSNQEQLRELAEALYPYNAEIKERTSS